MNCKIKSMCLGTLWGLGLIIAMLLLLALLSGLFILGNAYGVNVAAIVSIVGFAIIFFGAANVGYEYHLKKCKVQS